MDASARGSICWAWRSDANDVMCSVRLTHGLTGCPTFTGTGNYITCPNQMCTTKIRSNWMEGETLLGDVVSPCTEQISCFDFLWTSHDYNFFFLATRAFKICLLWVNDTELVARTSCKLMIHLLRGAMECFRLSC